MRTKEVRLWENACRYIPRGTMTLSKCPDQFVEGVYPIFADRAYGATIVGIDGREYLDFMCGLGPIVLGYGDPVVNEAIKKQLEKGTIFPLPTLLETKLAKLIVETVPSAEMVRFAKNGTDVCTAAVRIARSYTGKEHVLKCGYHGWSDWHGITTGREHGIPKSMKKIISEFKYNDLDDLESLLKKYEVACIIMEAEALEAPKPGYLDGVRELATKYEALLIFDEVVTGYRWGLGGAQEMFDVIPDLTTLGKSIANGLPLSVICGKKKYMEELNHVFFSMTFGGECLSMAAAVATIEELKKKDYGALWELNRKFIQGINNAATKHKLLINFAGTGLRHNLTFDKSYKDPSGMRDLFYQRMIDFNVFFSNVLYLQFSHTESDIEDAVAAAEQSFAFVKANMNDIDGALNGKRSVSVFLKRDKDEED